tara:strand:+ start:1236 stop:2138 length:903 start_codon:yes stop_codon:yes gene_type:complete
MIIEEIYLKTGSTKLDINALSKNIAVNTLNQIQDKSGIFNRHVCSDNEDSFQLSKDLITNHNLFNKITKSELIIVVSENVKNIIPPPSSFIFSEFEKIKAPIIDLNKGCSGFVEALTIVDTYFISKKIKNACIICADNYSQYISPKNRSMAPIFGDAASITFLSDNGKYILHEDTASLPIFKDDLSYSDQKGISMNGANIVHFIKSSVFESIDKILDLETEEIDYFFVHQGSKFVVDAFIEKYNLNLSSCPFVIEETGNLNSSSIPLIMNDIGLEKISGKRCLLSAFGVGLSYSNILLEL